MTAIAPLAPRRILVTGAAGFVGLHLAAALGAAFPQAELTLCGVSSRTFDICDPDAVADLVRRTSPDACVHLAGVSATDAAQADIPRAWAVNLHGSLNLAQAILRDAPGCVLLHVSSGEVYGGTADGGVPLDEESVLRPRTVYAATKAAADLAIGALASQGLRAIRLRPFNHIGPGQSDGFAVSAFARQIARIEAGLQQPVLSTGRLDARRDFLDVRDVCAAYVAALSCAGALPPGAVLNVASGRARRIGDVLAELLALAGAKIAVEAVPGLIRANDAPLSVADGRLARRVLGWAPRIAWSRTLGDVLNDWRARVRLGGCLRGGNPRI